MAATRREKEMPLKTLVQQGLYEVDARRVADAIVLRILGGMAHGPEPRVPQKECSKPSSWRSASRNAAAG
jgi:hypothetical protein